MAKPNIVFTQEQAIDVATEDSGGFLGTWVEASLYTQNWLIEARSKSLKAPLMYVVDSSNGKILYKNLNPSTSSLVGKAIDSNGFAAVEMQNGFVVYLDHIAAWKKPNLGKRVRVRGALLFKEFFPNAHIQSDGGETCSVAPKQLVMEHPRWAADK